MGYIGEECVGRRGVENLMGKTEDENTLLAWNKSISLD